MVYSTFKKRLLRNYIVGSIAAIGTVSTIFMFTNLSIASSEKILMLLLLIGSTLIMFAAEMTMYSFHVKPISFVYEDSDHSKESIKSALVQVKQFPVLTVKRIFIPHFLGLTIPLSLGSYMLIKLEIISLTLIYIPYIFAVGFLAASLHAVVEFYLTLYAIQPLLADLRCRLYEESVTLLTENEIVVSIKRKLQFTILVVGIIPVLIFLLASILKFLEWKTEFPIHYMLWSVIIVTTFIIYALLIAHYMYRDIQKPISELLLKMKSAQNNNYEYVKGNVYTDEFSQLISGFNHMIKGVKSRDDKNTQLLNSFITVLTASLDARDPYTGGHSARVAQFSSEIGKRIGLSGIELEKLMTCATFHDIGKIGVPDYVLLKEGELTDEEFSQIKAHPSIGENILKQISPQDEIKDLLPGVRSHHERFDGKGYPDGLVGHGIPLYGRIIAVADAFDAMTSDRPYRKGMTVEKAVAILKNGSGTQWDSEMVEALIQYIEVSGYREIHKANQE